MSRPLSTCLSTVPLLVVALATAAWPEEPRGDKEPAKVLKEARRVWEDRLRLRKALLEVLERDTTVTETSREKEEVIRLLGLFGAEEAIRKLIQDIDLPGPVAFRSERTIGNDYPAVGALSRIGKPATQPLLDAIAGCKDADRRYLYFWALAGTETWPGAILLLENRLKETKDEQAAANLRAALKIAKRP